jgi:hypothetical protein
MLQFKCYLCGDGKDVIREWYLEQDTAIQGDFTGVLLQLERNRRARYNEEIFKRLEKHNSSKSCVGFYEIRFIKDGTHFRIIGFLIDDTFTMLVPLAKTNGNKYKCPCDKAARRKAAIDNDGHRPRDWEYPEIAG